MLSEVGDKSLELYGELISRMVGDIMGQEIIEFERDPERIRQIIQSVGCTIGSVHFKKWKDDLIQKISYRLHVQVPFVAVKPTGPGDRQQVDQNNDQITVLAIMVLDVNKVVRDQEDNIVGRGAWQTVPLDRVTQVSVKGKTYKIL